jgi:putative DNA primase/helicase
MNDAISQFRDAMHAAGLEPPDVIEPGKLHRFPGISKRNGNTAGWCKLFDDGLGGCFGDWSSGFSENWQAKREKPFSTAERKAFKSHVAEAQVQAEAERKARQAEATAKTAAIWNAATPAPGDHPYLMLKGIQPHGARLHNGALLIPMREGGELHSLQFIGPNGDKRFLTGGRMAGCYFSIGGTQGAAALCIAEGFATGATIHQATGHPVAVAFNAGNLESVAQAMRERFPALPLIVCADDDAGTEGNPGLTKANEAARAIGGLLAVPDFGPDRRKDATDFNDMAAVRGMEAVRDAINHAAAPDDDGGPGNAPAGEPWPEPQPLAAKVDSEPYPVDALPDTIRAAVEEVQDFTKAPVPLVASSALATLSLATQAHADAKRAEKLTGPASLFLLTIADSGERKSTCDGFFTKAIREHEEAQAELAKPALKDHKAAIEAWEAKRGGIKEKIRQLAKENKPTANLEAALRDLEHDKPEPPRVPRLLYADATPEALAFGLAKNWPSGGVVSAEAGIVFGAHGMSKDSVMRNLALLNVLWDGGHLTIDRRTAESFTVRGARLTVALQVQEATLRSFFDRSGGLARGTGFLARFLVAWPESTQGFRPFTEAPANWPTLAAFNRRIAAILEQPAPVDENGGLTPLLLPLTAEAKAAWVAFHDAIESELASGGELYDVRDVASKTADNAVRLAALFQIFEGSGGAISAEAFESASRIAAWHLNEARRFFGELALPAELANAARLDGWLLDYCRRHKTNFVPRREVQRNVTPVHLRQKAVLEDALRELIEAGRVLLVQDGRRKEIHVNPALLEGSAV